MSRSLFSLALSSFLLAASPAFAVFSEFVSVSPANDTKHQNMKPVIKAEGSLVTIQLPYKDGPLKYWLVVSDKPLTKDKQDFRKTILGLPDTRTDIVLIAPLAPSFDGQYLREVKDRKLEIRLNLSRELAQRAYIYHDFPGFVLADGGYYYTVDIPSYMLKKESQ
jgi:hypothetical protein